MSSVNVTIRGLEWSGTDTTDAATVYVRYEWDSAKWDGTRAHVETVEWPGILKDVDRADLEPLLADFILDVLRLKADVDEQRGQFR